MKTSETNKEVLHTITCQYCGEVLHTFEGERDEEYLNEYPDSSADWIREIKSKHLEHCEVYNKEEAEVLHTQGEWFVGKLREIAQKFLIAPATVHQIVTFKRRNNAKNI